MTHLQQIAAQLWDAGSTPCPQTAKTSGPEQVRLNLNGATTSHNGCSERPSTSTSGTRAASASSVVSPTRRPVGPWVIDVDTKNDPSGTIWAELEQTVKGALPGVWERLTPVWYAHHPAVSICTTYALRLRPNKPPPVAALRSSAPATSPCSPTPGYYIEGGEAIDIHGSPLPSARRYTPSSGRSVRRPRRGHRDRPALAPATTRRSRGISSIKSTQGGRANQKRLDKGVRTR